MRRSIFLLLAIVNTAVSSSPMGPAARPVYGGSLRVQLREAVATYDPADTQTPRPALAETLIAALFDCLVRLDPDGRPQPGLAKAWQGDSESKVWRLSLRPGVKLHDGSLLTGDIAATQLGRAGDDWVVTAAGDTVRIQSETPIPDLPRLLAEPKRSIFHRTAGGRIVGSGPFRLAEWVPGRRATLVAHEEYWGGRPFLDSVAIRMGGPVGDQLAGLQLGKTDLVQIGPGDARRLSQRGMRTWSSAPTLLFALAFGRDRPAIDNVRVRQALASSIDRSAIHNVLLQKQGDPAGGILPQWLNGYAFLFPIGRDLGRARKLLPTMSGNALQLTLSFERADPLARATAERIAVDAREAGITLQLASGGVTDIRLVRVPIPAADPGRALTDIASWLAPGESLNIVNAPLEEIYRAERSLLESFRVIPLYHMPVLFASSPKVKTWLTTGISNNGALILDDLWLDMGKP